jgi:hypothetical protein
LFISFVSYFLFYLSLLQTPMERPPNASRPVPAPTDLTVRFRLCGLLPLSLFLVRFFEYALIIKAPVHILWSCHIANLMLGLGLFLANRLMIRMASYLLILGVLPWLLDMAVIQRITLVSLLSHLSGAAMTLIVLRRVRIAPNCWLYTMIFFLALQQLTRLVTDPGPYTNINVAHYPYGPWKDLFASYFEYWLVNSALLALTLWLIESILLKLFPAKDGKSPLLIADPTDQACA